jgi:hypothetical protein
MFITFVCIIAFCANLNIEVTNLYSAELYPTNIRTVAIAVCMFAFDAAGVFMPWIINYMIELSIFSPFILMAITSFLAALITFCIKKDTSSRAMDYIS